MTELESKALKAAIETENLDIGWPEQVERVITAYLATRREQGWVEVRVDDDVVANSIVAAAVEAERTRCAVILREMPEELVDAVRERAELATGVFSIAGAINGVADWLDQQADHQ